MRSDKMVEVPADDADIRELVAFGHTFDGYAATGSLEACVEVGERMRARFALGLPFDAPLRELRAALFVVFRAHRFGGTDPADELPFIRALVREIRRLGGPTVEVEFEVGRGGADRDAAVEEYRDDDDGYLRWLAEHPDGFVVNAWWPATSADPKLHRATCRWISGMPQQGTWTAGSYYKIVAGTAEALLAWARTNARRTVGRCPTCRP